MLLTTDIFSATWNNSQLQGRKNYFIFPEKKFFLIFYRIELSSLMNKKFLIFFQGNIFLIYQEGTFQARKAKKKAEIFCNFSKKVLLTFWGDC